MTPSSKKLSSEEVYGRILEIISELSEEQKRKLLERLEKWQQSRFEEKRQYPRKQTFIWTECSVSGRILTDIIQNLSLGGLFIETKVPFFVGEELSMTFSLPNEEEPIGPPVAARVPRGQAQKVSRVRQELRQRYEDHHARRESEPERQQSSIRLAGHEDDESAQSCG